MSELLLSSSLLSLFLSFFFFFLPRNTWHTTCYFSLLGKNNNLTWTSCVYFLMYPSSQHSFMYLSIHWYLLCPPMKLSYWMLEMYSPTVEVRQVSWEIMLPAQVIAKYSLRCFPYIALICHLFKVRLNCIEIIACMYFQIDKRWELNKLISVKI